MTSNEKGTKPSGRMTTPQLRGGSGKRSKRHEAVPGVETNTGGVRCLPFLIDLTGARSVLRGGGGVGLGEAAR